VSIERPDPINVAAQLFRERYKGALIIFLAGSVIRKQATASSDLDMIVLFEKLPNAYRESFIFQGWPVEVFVHDLETLKYFFMDEIPLGNPSTMHMVGEGLEVPGPTPLSQSLKQVARSLLDAGPPPFSRAENDRIRYMITSLVSDIKHPRTRDEMVAAGTLLYERLAYYFFRTHGLWSHSGKLLARGLYEADASFAAEYSAAFTELFNGRPERIFKIIEELLAPHGGLLFDGYRYDAPPTWRIPIAGKK
jgi:hypothetical protein